MNDLEMPERIFQMGLAPQTFAVALGGPLRRSGGARRARPRDKHVENASEQLSKDDRETSGRGKNKDRRPCIATINSRSRPPRRQQSCDHRRQDHQRKLHLVHPKPPDEAQGGQ